MSPRRSNARDPFEALADPTRREILDLLRKEPACTAGQLARAFPRISRPAVSRHLRILREANLAIAEEVGREWHYRLNVPALARMHRDWFARFTPLWEASLEQLKKNVEGSAGQPRVKQRRRGVARRSA